MVFDKFDRFNFNIGEDEYFSIYDITIANMNRPHKHSHIEEGLESYSPNWELVEHNQELRRGSSNLYLVDDAYYVECSRTGFEKAGNCLRFSGNSPDELMFSVVSATFEGVLRRNSIDISEGIDLFNSDNKISVCSPREFMLAEKCTEEEIESYYNELADLLYETIGRYQDCSTVGEIEEVVEYYKDESKALYRSYTDFKPSILSRVIPDIDGQNGWIVGSGDIDGGKTLYVIRHEDSGIEKDAFCIEIVQDEVVEIVEQATGTVLKRAEYETENGLERILDRMMDYTFEELKEREY